MVCRFNIRICVDDESSFSHKDAEMVSLNQVFFATMTRLGVLCFWGE